MKNRIEKSKLEYKNIFEIYKNLFETKKRLNKLCYSKDSTVNESTGYDEVSFNIIKKCFISLHKPLLHIFNASLQNGTFPDEIKISSATLLFKIEVIQT